MSRCSEPVHLWRGELGGPVVELHAVIHLWRSKLRGFVVPIQGIVKLWRSKLRGLVIPSATVMCKLRAEEHEVRALLRVIIMTYSSIESGVLCGGGLVVESHS